MELPKFVNDLMQSVGLQTWVLQVFIVVFLTLVLVFVLKRVLGRLQAKLEQTNNPWDDALIAALRKPVTAVVWIVGIAFAIQIIEKETQAAIFGAIEPIRDVGIIAAISWFLVRFIKRAENNLVAANEAKGKETDRTTVDAIAKLLRLSVMITAALVALQSLGFSVSGVLAFGGIGGIAVGFAAKDLLANFFGGLMIYLDRPFAPGDVILSADRDIEGTVEEIGWRLTRVRAFDSRPLYIPNSVFTNIVVVNSSRREYRRIYETIGLRYTDLTNMDKVVSEVETMLRQHEAIDADKTMMVNFNKFEASSLDFFIYCFTHTTSWVEFHEVKQDVMLKIADIIKANHAEIAFPTSTIHLADSIVVENS